MSGHSVIPFARGRRQGPSFAELAERARRLQEESLTGSLQSARTVLMALFLSADEALERLPDESARPLRRDPAFESSLGAVGAYLVHACELTDLSLGDLIAERFAEDESGLAAPPQRSAR